MTFFFFFVAGAAFLVCQLWIFFCVTWFWVHIFTSICFFLKVVSVFVGCRNWVVTTWRNLHLVWKEEVFKYSSHSKATALKWQVLILSFSYGGSCFILHFTYQYFGAEASSFSWWGADWQANPHSLWFSSVCSVAVVCIVPIRSFYVPLVLFLHFCSFWQPQLSSFAWIKVGCCVSFLHSFFFCCYSLRRWSRTLLLVSTLHNRSRDKFSTFITIF